MGTRGLIAIRYKGWYYIKDNSYDSYPERLGQDLVNAIPTSQKAFEEWLETQKEFCESMEADDNWDDSDYKKSWSEPANDLSIQWTYTYDLDHLLFAVDSRAQFSLRGIAQKQKREWTQFIGMDARGNRCLSLDTPSDLIGRFESISEPFLGQGPNPAVNDFVQTSIISPSTWLKPLTPHHRRLMLAQVNATIAERYGDLPFYPLPDYEPSIIGVQQFAMEFLEAIVPNSQAFVVSPRSPTFKASQSESLLRKRCPWFWYRGCLILLATKLDNNKRFQVYIQAVAARVKAKNLDRCTALLWSIHHVAVIEISEGRVSHSDPIPLLAAYGSDEEGFMNALHLLWHYLPYPRRRIVDQGDPKFENLPTKVVMKIMMFTDQLHHPKYQFLSRGFFELWWKQLRVASYTVLPDDEEVEETSRSFKAYSADENVKVALRLKFSWGKQSGNIWHTDQPRRSKEPRCVWTTLFYRVQGGGDENEEKFSKGTYRLQRFYSYWPEDLPSSYKSKLPRVSDEFSSQSNILTCEVTNVVSSVVF